MARTADFHNGMVVQSDKRPWALVHFQDVKPGKGGAFARAGLENVLTGAAIEAPLFLEAGNVVRVARREDKSITRV